MKNFKQLVNFPFITKVKGDVKVKVDQMCDSRVPEAHDIFLKYASTGDGLSKDSFQSREEFHRWLMHESHSYYAEDLESGELMGVMNVTPSPLTRTPHPLVQAGYVVIHPRMAKLSFGRELMMLFWVAGRALGYRGVVGRTSALNTAIYMSLKKLSMAFTGYIPHSFTKGEGVWVDDAICTMNTETLNSPLEDTFTQPRDTPSLPSFSLSDNAPSCQDTLSIDHAANITLRDGSRIEISQATADERGHIDKWIHDEARLGAGGFGVDEFDEAGRWSRRLLYRSSTLAVRGADSEEFLAGCIVGPSRLSRSPNPITMGIYVIIPPEHRGRGIATHVIDTCHTIAQSLGYTQCVMDIYVHNTTAIDVARKHGYVPQAMVPGSGYFYDRGYVETVLYFKNLQPPRLRERFPALKSVM